MPEKTVKEMTALERRHYSLEARMFHAVEMASAVLGLVALLIGLGLYLYALVGQYVGEAFGLARSASMVVEQAADTETLVGDVMAVYRNLSQEERTGSRTEAYRANYAEISSGENYQICANNREEMFVTVWFGVLDTETGKITAANAGHEYPVLMQAGGQFELVKDKHGFVIGGMDGMRYKEYELTLTPGSRLFLYTDGVPEATNAQREMFGTDRMLDALNEAPDAAPEMILKNVRKAVDGFVEDAEQFDDLTMLCVEYKGVHS